MAANPTSNPTDDPSSRIPKPTPAADTPSLLDERLQQFDDAIEEFRSLRPSQDGQASRLGATVFHKDLSRAPAMPTEMAQRLGIAQAPRPGASADGWNESPAMQPPAPPPSILGAVGQELLRFMPWLKADQDNGAARSVGANLANGRHIAQQVAIGVERKLSPTVIVDRAIIIPAHNEERTIVSVIRTLHTAQPHSVLVVVCNACSDDTYPLARDTLRSLPETTGYVLLREDRPGKTMALRAGMASVNARAYAWIDADETYPASALEALFYMVEAQLCDMACGDRISSGAYDDQNVRKGHSFGNRLVRGMLSWCFRSSQPLRDPMTGLRVMNAAMAEAYAMTCSGFEVEIDISAFALNHRMRVVETAIDYFERPAGSQSKLNTWQDGSHIVLNMVRMMRIYRPLAYFGIIGMAFLAAGLLAGVAPIADFVQTGQVIHLPRAVLATGCILLAFIQLMCGLVLDALSDGQRREVERNFSHAKRNVNSLKFAH